VSEDRTGAPRQTERRVTVSEAAQVLGISPEAVRMRIKRGTLRSMRRAGRVYVLLGLEPNTEHTTDRTPDHTEELIRTLREQLELERQAHAEARRLLAAALERIPAIEAPQEPSESSAHSPGPVPPGGVGCSGGEVA
jgi:excisionase family DNA binding protein